MFMWVGLGASADFLQDVFGVGAIGQLDIEMVSDVIQLIFL